MHLIATLTFTSALPPKSNRNYHGRNLLARKWIKFKWSQLSWCSEMRREGARDGTYGAGSCLRGYQSQRVGNNGARGSLVSVSVLNKLLSRLEPRMWPFQSI